jgi:hypothetical protein
MTVWRNFPLVAGGPIDQQQLTEHWRERLAAPPLQSTVMDRAEAMTPIRD